tara:strand:+ start:700 stop:1077 length:378 start_codon:yes stop_codon:yes gene_type:complete
MLDNNKDGGRYYWTTPRRRSFVEESTVFCCAAPCKLAAFTFATTGKRGLQVRVDTQSRGGYRLHSAWSTLVPWQTLSRDDAETVLVETDATHFLVSVRRRGVGRASSSSLSLSVRASGVKTAARR